MILKSGAHYIEIPSKQMIEELINKKLSKIEASIKRHTTRLNELEEDKTLIKFEGGKK